MSKHHEVTKLAATSDQYEEEMTTFGYAVVGAKNVRNKLCIQSEQLYYYHLASYIYSNVCTEPLNSFTLSQ